MARTGKRGGQCWGTSLPGLESRGLSVGWKQGMRSRHARPGGIVGI